jgi:hypothetical protein
MSKLEHLKALCERATPGPWKVLYKTGADSYVGNWEINQKAIHCEWHGYVCKVDGQEHPSQEMDAEFIAACNPETILKLLSIIEIQGKALEHCYCDDLNMRTCPNCEALTAVDGILGTT